MRVIKVESFNTNNSWGFGGMIGTDTYYDNGLILRKARNYHRHTGTSSANGWLITNIDDEYPEFSIRVNGRKSDKVYVYRSGGSYRAFFKEHPNFNLYGEKWTLVKVVTIEI